jgi:hypothetical protein
MGDVSFYEQFELLEMLRDDGVKSFRAREIATGRDVEAHIFVNPHAPLSVALMSRLNKLPPSERERIVHRGKNQGTPYVVTTPFSDYAGLREWLSVKRTATAVNPGEHVRGEFTRLTPIRESALETVPREAGPPKEFTRLVLNGSNGSRPTSGVHVKESLPPSGEFARMALIKAGIMPEGMMGKGVLADPQDLPSDAVPTPANSMVIPEPVILPEPPLAISTPESQEPVAEMATPVPPVVEEVAAGRPSQPPEPFVPHPIAGWPPPPLQASMNQEPASAPWIAPPAPVPAPPPQVRDWKEQLPQYISLALSILALMLVLLMFFTRR